MTNAPKKIVVNHHHKWCTPIEVLSSFERNKLYFIYKVIHRTSWLHTRQTSIYTIYFFPVDSVSSTLFFPLHFSYNWYRLPVCLPFFSNKIFFFSFSFRLWKISFCFSTNQLFSRILFENVAFWQKLTLIFLQYLGLTWWVVFRAIQQVKS